MAADIVGEIQELRQLLHYAKRPRVQSLLSSHISGLEKQAAAAAAEQKPKMERKFAPPAVTYTTLTTLSWDQDNEKVKIYIPLEGACQEKMVADIQSASFDLKIHDVGGKNFRYSILKLNKSIVPDQSTVLAKPKRVIVSLKKTDLGDWQDLHKKEEKSKAPASDKENPMAGIMEMMKNMYDEGDDEMKKTISKAWCDAQSGKLGNKV